MGQGSQFTPPLQKRERSITSGLSASVTANAYFLGKIPLHKNKVTHTSQVFLTMHLHKQV